MFLNGGVGNTESDIEIGLDGILAIGGLEIDGLETSTSRGVEISLSLSDSRNEADGHNFSVGNTEFISNPLSISGEFICHVVASFEVDGLLRFRVLLRLLASAPTSSSSPPSSWFVLPIFTDGHK